MPATPRRFSYSARDGLEIAAYRWDPPAGQAPRGIVQLTHGMGEHVVRYGELAAALNARGWVVYGQDHRGHGATAASDTELGQIGGQGWRELVRDVDLLAAHAREQHPGLPFVLFGHSMGSFAVQQYLLDHSDGLSAVVLTGTAAIDLLEPALDLDQPLDLAAFNAAFEPARTDYDWLSRDDAQVDAYVADPRCGFGLDVPAVKAMFAAARPLAEPAAMAGVHGDLPIYIAVGELDPVNGQLALVHALVDRYRAAGLTDLTLRTYPEARHEVLNETNRDQVVADLLDWLDRAVPA
jgi:alpha-beta hydrolase superfamily lysophospholipase